MRKRIRSVWVLITACSAWAELTPPEPGLAGMTDYVPPADSGWINVVTDLGAKGDGVTDDTAAFAAFKPKNPHSVGTLYFPTAISALLTPDSKVSLSIS